MTITADRRHRHRHRRILAWTVALALVLGACSSGADDTGGAAGDEASVELGPEDPAARDGAPPPDDGEAAVGEGAEAPTGGVDLAVVVEGRQIVSTAEVELTAADADAAATRIADLAADAGGFVSDENTSRVGGTRTTLVVRVPPEEFGAVLDALAELGDLTAQRISTDEVTEQVVDLESRITTAEASVDRLRALLARTGSVADIAQVEAELLARETTLETLRGQLRTVEAQVALATITVEVESEDATPVVDEDERPSFLSGLAAGWDAFVLFWSGAAAVVGAALPWLAVGSLIGLPLWRVLRARRRSATAATG